MRRALWVVVAVLAVSPFVFGGRNGATKTPVMDGETQVGWAILNTDCEGFLVVNVHLDDGLAEEAFTVRVNGGIVGSLETNRKGKGNFYTEIDLPDDVGEVIDVRVTLVAIIPGGPDDPTAVVRYRTDLVSVPVKGPCEEETPE